MNKLREKLYYAGLENISENLVFRELNDYVKEIKKEIVPKFCTCSICLADVAAIVLNGLKTNYCTNFMDKGRNKQYRSTYIAKVRRKIAEAFHIVNENPHHL
ncbi:MAG: late competence development ComFB family protein [Clostridium sp.]|nr:late competence development ComFB family protein [Clostridium sp.]